mmetsp:Transcript_44395/g.70294  ORF Transcript_44395/g.70294 Transcript_44395/m.70294 type:complete len:243 (-) Transcript_44395:2-730(-)
MLAIRRRQMHQIGAVFSKQGVGSKVSTETTSAKDDRSMLLKLDATLLVNKANHATAISLEQFGSLCLGDNTRLVCGLRNLLHHLNQRVGDRHSREALLSTMCAGSRVSSQTCHKRKVQIESVHEPLHIPATIFTEHLNNFWLFGTTLERVFCEQVGAILDSFSSLSPGSCTVDATRSFGRIPAAERRLVYQDCPTTILHHGVASRHACQATSHDNNLICGEVARHGFKRLSQLLNHNYEIWT